MNKYQEDFDLLVKLNPLDNRERTCYNYALEKGRNDAIEEFAEKCNQKITEFILEHKDQLTFASGVSVAWNIIDEIAESMKGGKG